ncbi:unnamed protein product, partial [Effrenium voratum]
MAENRVLCTDPEEGRKMEELKKKREELASRKATLLANVTKQMKAIMAKLNNPNNSEATRETLRSLLLGLKEKLDSLAGPKPDRTQQPAIPRSHRLDLRSRVLKFQLSEATPLEVLREELRKLGADEVVDLRLEPGEEGDTAVVDQPLRSHQNLPSFASRHMRRVAGVLLLGTVPEAEALASWADGRWYDVSPFFSLPSAICKKLPHCTVKGCPQPVCGSWSSFGRWCYLLIGKHLVFPDARQRCQEHDAVLASVQSKEENEFLRRLCGPRFCWLGLKELADTEEWRWLDGSDASAGAFWNWAPGEPNNNGQDESVAVMNWNLEEDIRESPHTWANGLWYDMPASFNLGQVICERSEWSCHQDWKSFRGSCYQLQSWPGTFQEAQGRCEEASAHLVTIQSAEEQEFVQQLCGERMCWLGLEEPPGSESWRWVDGTELAGYQNWEQGEPNNFGDTDEDRACMNLHFGEVLKNAPDTWRRSQRLVAVQKEQSAHQAQLAQQMGLADWADGTWYDAPLHFNFPLPLCKSLAICRDGECGQDSCRPGWKLWGLDCYKLLFSGVGYDAAATRCEEHGAFLVSVRSAEENLFVQKLCGSHFCWLGLRRRAHSASWSWMERRGSDPGHVRLGVENRLGVSLLLAVLP